MDRPLHFDRQGNPLETLEWARLFEDRDGRIVSQVELPNGKWVSTVWIGTGMGYGDSRPLIFETMVFPTAIGGRDLDCERYATEAEALAGHAEMVKKWRVRPNKRLKKRVRAKKIGRQREDAHKTHRQMYAWYRKRGGT